MEEYTLFLRDLVASAGFPIDIVKKIMDKLKIEDTLFLRDLVVIAGFPVDIVKIMESYLLINNIISSRNRFH